VFLYSLSNNSYKNKYCNNPDGLPLLNYAVFPVVGGHQPRPRHAVPDIIGPSGHHVSKHVTTPDPAVKRQARRHPVHTDTATQCLGYVHCVYQF